MAEVNPFRFSTKYQDETGLLYYGYRYYDPSTGRWNSRDPLHDPAFRTQWDLLSPTPRGDEAGYIFVDNESVATIDFLGLLVFDASCTPSQISDITKGLKDRCKQAKQNNCFRCIKTKFQSAIDDYCKTVDDPTKGPKVFCADQKSNPKECGPNSNWGGWTDSRNRIHLCINKYPPTGNGDIGCTMIHEGAHAVGDVGYDGKPYKSSSDNRAYAIQKCAGCATDPKIPLPPGY